MDRTCTLHKTASCNTCGYMTKKKLKKKIKRADLGVLDLKKEKIKKSVEDRWILVLGDKFGAIAKSHSFPFALRDTSSGTIREYSFDVGECSVKYSVLGRDTKVKVVHPENPNKDHLAICKAIRSKLVAVHYPLVKAMGDNVNVGHNMIQNQKKRMKLKLKGRVTKPVYKTLSTSMPSPEKPSIDTPKK